MLRLLTGIVSYAAITLGLAAAAQAMTVSPMQVEMTPAGGRSHAQVTVVNTSAHALPIEAVVQRMTHDEGGKPHVTAASEDFLIMPPQAMIPPGATQVFRVQWLGDPMLARSESFLLFLNQVPVKLPKGTSGVQVVMSMGVMINVASASGAPALKVVSAGIVKDKSGKRFPSITVENPSNTHALLPQATVHLSSEAWAGTLTPRHIGDRIGIGLVQPGRRRKFTLPVELPASAGAATLNARIEFEPKR